jgi:hypothetical protein
MRQDKDEENLYDEARVMHKQLDDKLRVLEEKSYLTNEEKLEVKVLKKKKLHYKDIMEAIKEVRG